MLNRFFLLFGPVKRMVKAAYEEGHTDGCIEAAERAIEKARSELLPAAPLLFLEPHLSEDDALPYDLNGRSEEFDSDDAP